MSNPQNANPIHPRGFSLVELVLVMALLSIVTALAAPRFAAAAAHQRAQAAARRITTDLAVAQRRAKLTSAPVTITFDVVADTYAVSGMSDPDRPSQPYVVSLSFEPYGATVLSAVFGGDALLIYDGFGVPDSTGTIVIQVGGYTQTITVGPNEPLGRFQLGS